MEENERLIKARKINMKLYPIYRMVGFDIVFLYAIKMLFLTQVKGVNPQDVILSISFYALYMVLLQVPVTMAIKKIGYVRSVFISNIFNIIYICLLMVSTNIWWLLFAEFISALTFSFKDVAEPSLLSMSIPKTENRGNIYSKLDGKGNSRYNLLNSFANVISGFVYLINPYLPLILSISCSVIACIISLQFQEIGKKHKKKEKEENVFANYINDLKISFKFILKSRRLRALLLFSGVFWGLRCLVMEYKDSILIDIETSAFIIGIIGAILELSSSIAAKKQGKFHKKFRNKSLTYIAISFVLGILITGIIAELHAPFVVQLIFIVISFIVISVDNAMTAVLMNRYLSNFSNYEILPKIYSANSIARNFSRLLFGVSGAILLSITGSAHAMIIAGIFALIIMTLIIRMMKSNVGLKPEQYRKEDIEFKLKNVNK